MPEDISKISDEELMARIQRLREVRIPSPQGQGKKSRPRRLDDAPSKRQSIFDQISSTPGKTIIED